MTYVEQSTKKFKSNSMQKEFILKSNWFTREKWLNGIYLVLEKFPKPALKATTHDL